MLNALVGSAGLGPTVATLGEGIDLALANKESLVVGGELVTQLAEATGAQIIPVDSEHSALHQLIAAERAGHDRQARPDGQRRPVPRPQRAPSSRASRVEEALQHPTWAMGGKITIDSATLMNKGLELIEAHHLFGTPYERIDVVVHPQSIVHSYVLLCDGAALAHLGYPDMRVPISYALHYPERVDVPVRPLDLAEVGALTFEPVDNDAFPCLRLAREAARRRRHRAVRAQRRQRGRRPRLPQRAARLPRHPRGHRDGARAPAGRPVRAFESLYEADREARAVAAELIAVPRVSWLLAFARLRRADHPARVRALRRGQGRRACASSASRCSSRRCWRKVRRGETEYAIGAIPLGGYVKITGMSPHEELPPEVAPRAYFNQPPWKRIVVIAAGPGDELADRLRAGLGASSPSTACRPTTSWSAGRAGQPGRRQAAARRQGRSRSTASRATSPA